MIRGRVSEILLPTVRVRVEGLEGRIREVETLVDTGFNGSLTLPPGLIAELLLPWRTRGSALLANGKEDQFDLYVATVRWGRFHKRILVEAVDTDPLPGMNLLAGHKLTVDAVVGGTVFIEPLP